MPIRSRYTGRTSHREQPAPTQAAPKEKGAIRRFAEWVDKNQKDYQRATGDTSIMEDISYPVKRCLRETGNYGEENRQDIRRRCKNDYFDDLPYEVVNRPHQNKRQMEFVIDTPRSNRLQNTERSRKTRARRQSPKIIERTVYVPMPPRDK
jgi:hypothetical protein